jgi:hypothetical protein
LVEDRRDFRVGKSGQGFRRAEAGDVQSEPRQRLGHFRADRAQADDGDARRQGRLLEQCIGGQNAVAEDLPVLGTTGRLPVAMMMLSGDDFAVAD